MLKDSIQNLLGQVREMNAANAEELEALRIKYLSKKGEITTLFNEFRTVPSEQKRELGQLLNQLRQETEGRINELREKLAESQEANAEKLDLTRTPDPIALGTRHPLSIFPPSALLEPSMASEVHLPRECRRPPRTQRHRRTARCQTRSLRPSPARTHTHPAPRPRSPPSRQS